MRASPLVVRNQPSCQRPIRTVIMETRDGNQHCRSQKGRTSVTSDPPDRNMPSSISSCNTQFLNSPRAPLANPSNQSSNLHTGSVISPLVPPVNMEAGPHTVWGCACCTCPPPRCTEGANPFTRSVPGLCRTCKAGELAEARTQAARPSAVSAAAASSASPSSPTPSTRG